MSDNLEEIFYIKFYGSFLPAALATGAALRSMAFLFETGNGVETLPYGMEVVRRMKPVRSVLIGGGAAAAISAVALVVASAPSLHLPSQPVFSDDGPVKAGRQPIQVLASGSGQSDEPNHAVSRAVAPDIVAPPDTAWFGLERVAARPPLSEIGLASPPKPIRPDDWEGTVLFRPVVTSSASFEAMGYAILVAGTEPVGLDQSCEFEGVAWRCGERAELAFRYWLRGRAPLCQVFPPAERQPVAAACRLGKQDIGAWLVSNGWAYARPGGGYEKAEAVARKAKMGVFGPPD
ncbi:endonuclease YncB(thermonuclease family) [Aminobacter lissarensis]|uniref:Endonuclease YncB(Thermonuclease family) n=1 Tax=Aminobacter carboxidus TaxID=376165 RepID=A0A8E2BDY3_9HYPH|nr:thermonuclease family protein [Aminobacter lissarensis]MBB6468503.1 endonuclease YncB(thermonuclease family) [Aminobacter lissarensis]